MRKLVTAFLRLATVFPIPSGIVPDSQGMYSLFGLMANTNAALPNMTSSITTTATAITASAAQLLAGRLLFDGTAGGGVTLTTPSGPQIISFFGPTVQTNNTFGGRTRLLNSSGQQITVSGSTGVVTSGTMTIADGAWRDFLIMVGSASTVTVTNLGGGSV